MAVELAALDRVDGYEQDLDLGGREEEGGRIQGESGGGERWPGWLWRRAGCGVWTCRVGVLTVRVCAATAEQACEAELTLLSRADERAALSSTRSTALPPGSCRERATASTSTDGPGAPARRRPRAVLLPPLLLLLSLSLSLLPSPTLPRAVHLLPGASLPAPLSLARRRTARDAQAALVRVARLATAAPLATPAARRPRRAGPRPGRRCARG